MKKRRAFRGFELSYSFLVDNIKAVLIFLVVFNHLIAFGLVKESDAVRYIWYGITTFHMPAFIFVSGYLSKNRQNQLKNFKNLLIPYFLGYALTWVATVWSGSSMEFDLLRPSGTAMWYVLALFIYRCIVEALGKMRFAVPLTLALAIWAGTRQEFSTYLSVSRIVVFLPFFVAGYLWSDEMTRRLRRFAGKWMLFFLSGAVLFLLPHFMITQGIPVDLLRENHSYLLSGVSNQVGIVIRMFMYLSSFLVITTLFALMPDLHLPVSFIGRNTMSVYFFHYPLLILFRGLGLLKLPQVLSLPGNLLLSLALTLVLASPPIYWLYRAITGLVCLVFFKKPAKEEVEKDEVFLMDEYDNDDYFSYANLH